MSTGVVPDPRCATGFYRCIIQKRSSQFSAHQKHRSCHQVRHVRNCYALKLQLPRMTVGGSMHGALQAAAIRAVYLCRGGSKQLSPLFLQGRMSTRGPTPVSIVVAVDGPAASGKGTLAKLLAARLHLAHLDTGLLYRAIGHEALKAGAKLEDGEAVAQLASSIQWSQLSSEPQLRSEELGQAASIVSAHPAVRAALLQLQRDFAAQPPAAFNGAVLDGRDVGTVVCPDATAKLFVKADVAVRARRRHQELLERASAAAPTAATAAAAAAGAAEGGHPSVSPPAPAPGPTYEQVLQDMQQRDARDASRAVAPCVPAEDALVLDTTHLTPAEVLEAAVAFVRRRMAS